jgi:hypothetical protein
LIVEFHEAELADAEPCAAGLAPVVLDPEQPVIPEPRWGRVGGVATGTADDTDGQAVQLAADQAGVAGFGDLLIGDLPLGRWVVAAVAGVEDDLAVVLVVFVAAGY